MLNVHEQNYMTQSQNVPQVEEEAVNWYFYRVVYQSMIKLILLSNLVCRDKVHVNHSVPQIEC